jgi:Family of unknown function (DUF5677)
MDAELSRWVDEANNVGASGRWAAVNARIEQLCANPGTGNAWWVEVFSSLCASVFSEYLSLKRAYADARSETSLIAWRSRNLLELSVWSIYCSKSTENARRLYADGGRDVLGLFNAFAKWFAATGSEHSNVVAVDKAKGELSSRAAVQGIESLEGAYKSVSEAAKEVGMGEHFALSYRMLSKFAHPTAMQILAPPDDAKTTMQKDVFFSHGCLFFVGAFAALEGQVNPAQGDAA